MTISEGHRTVAVLGVDPSIAALGYGVVGYHPEHIHGQILRMGFISQSSGRHIDYHRRGFAIAQQLNSTVTSLGLTVDVVVEAQSNWQTDKGEDSKRSESIQKLYYTTGAIVALLSRNSLVRSIWTVIPVAWKGHESKKHMIRKALKFTAAQHIALPLKVPHDACEALLLAQHGYKLRCPVDVKPQFEGPFEMVYQRGELPADCTFEHFQYVIPDDESEGA